jgi:hypothetical protein
MWEAANTLTTERRHKVMEDTVWAGMIEKGACMELLLQLAICRGDFENV